MGWPGLKTMHYIEPDPGGSLWLSIIQSSVTFYGWATQTETDNVVKYYYVSQAEYDQSEAFLKEKNGGLRPIPKTMLIHSVVSTVSPYEIAVRDTSCHCDRCFLNIKESPCLGWRFHLLKDTETDEVEDDRNKITKNR